MMSLNQEANTKVEKILMVLLPNKYLAKYIRSVQDVYDNKFYLKKIVCSDYPINHIADYILDALKKRKRFRQYDCLKVLRAIIKNKGKDNLSPITITKLFYLYQHYIFDERQEIQWCVSSLLKDQRLLDSEIQWFIDNHDKSVHLINRLLRYPIQNEIIQKWALTTYTNKNLIERRSELIALLINDDIPVAVRNENKEVILWSVYYAKIENKIKSTLLSQLFSEEVFETFVDICLRLKLTAPLKKLVS